MYAIRSYYANGIKVAVIGSGPAGLTFSGDMAKLGYDVTVFEALHEIGGVLKYGIPEFRLPNAIVDVEIDILRKMGVSFETNFIVGRTASMEDLKAEGFKAFFTGSGAGLPRFMDIPGENYIGILSSNEYLTRVNLMDAANVNTDTPILKGQNVVVVGGVITSYSIHYTKLYDYAIEANTAKLVWKFKTNDIVHATPLIYNKNVYVGSFDGYFYALSAHNGDLIWKFKTVGDAYYPKGEIQKGATVYKNSVIFSYNFV